MDYMVNFRRLAYPSVPAAYPALVFVAAQDPEPEPLPLLTAVAELFHDVIRCNKKTAGCQSLHTTRGSHRKAQPHRSADR